MEVPVFQKVATPVVQARCAGVGSRSPSEVMCLRVQQDIRRETLPGWTKDNWIKAQGDSVLAQTFPFLQRVILPNARERGNLRREERLVFREGVLYRQRRELRSLDLMLQLVLS